MPTQIALQPGQIIDRRYTILEQLGHGGFGRTYLATDNRRHNERCVLKEFAPLMTAQPQAVDKARELFRREAAVLHQLRHPQIPEFREEFEIYDRGQARWILVQEWIEGETYLDLLQSGPFLEVQVIQFLQDFLPILDYLHQHHPPVIHRDIALDNILLNSATNRPTLIDFGTVKQAINPVSRAASQSTFIAKQGYSPPEQALGNAYPSSDLYALGVCAIALLTGQRSPAVLYDAHQDQWHWQSYLPEGTVSPAFASFLNRLLQAQPRHRYESTAAALAALNTLHAQGSAEPPTRLQRLTQRLTQPIPRPIPRPTGGQSPGRAMNFPGDRTARSSLPSALQQALTPPNQSPGYDGRATTQRTVAVGRPSGRTVLAPGATQRSTNTPETTQYIWPIWARPLLFAQPLLALLAYRVGPALLVLFLLYGGARQATRMVVAKVSTLPQPSLRRSPSESVSDQPAVDPSATNETAESTDTEEIASEPATDTTEKSDPIVSLPTIKLPEITLPKPPSIQFPTIQLPTIQLPKVEFPKIGFGQANPVKSCRKKAIARFQKLPPEQASWAQVDEQFAARHPSHPTPLEPENPDHSTYIQDWCTVAHDWLDQAESP